MEPSPLLVIYDHTGRIWGQTSDLTPPPGIPNITVTVPEQHVLVSIDTSDLENPVPVFEKIDNFWDDITENITDLQLALVDLYEMYIGG